MVLGLWTTFSEKHRTMSTALKSKDQRWKLFYASLWPNTVSISGRRRRHLEKRNHVCCLLARLILLQCHLKLSWCAGKFWKQSGNRSNTNISVSSGSETTDGPSAEPPLPRLQSQGTVMSVYVFIWMLLLQSINVSGFWTGMRHPTAKQLVRLSKCFLLININKQGLIPLLIARTTDIHVAQSTSNKRKASGRPLSTRANLKRPLRRT